MSISLTQKQMAAICGTTTRWIRKLTTEGTIGRGSNGKYTADSLSQYIEFLRRDNTENSDFQELLDREKYREKKRENDLAESLVAPVEVIEEVVDKGVAGVIAVLETLPLIMKRHFPDLTGDQVTLVKTAVAECRNSMADVEVKLDGE